MIKTIFFIILFREVFSINFTYEDECHGIETKLLTELNKKLQIHLRFHIENDNLIKRFYKQTIFSTS